MRIGVGLPMLVLRLRLCGHEEVAIVIVADVLLIQHRQLGQRTLLRIRIAHVPVGHEIVAVWIRMDEEMMTSSRMRFVSSSLRLTFS